MVGKGELEAATSGLDRVAAAYLDAIGYEPSAGRVALLPGGDGRPVCALLGTGTSEGSERAFFAGRLATELPAGRYRLENVGDHAELSALAFVLGGYVFDRYRRVTRKDVRLHVPEGVEPKDVMAIADGVFLARDLINTPSSDMGPEELETAARDLAARHGAAVEVVTGEALLEANLPMVHAVGRASTRAPRLIDLRWGDPDARAVTIVGKGVCFDTGGLDIKPHAGMLLMKKDMGGAAAALGLAHMIMATGLNLRLRVLIPAVENAISGNAFRPGDVLRSRAGITVEVGNTDAEGRLILADALTLAEEEEPGLLLDFATLTGAARVALGPDIPPFFTRHDGLAAALMGEAQEAGDPIWRLPLWTPYERMLKSKVADTDNTGQGGFAGSITAALFLSRFVSPRTQWAHFDIYGWNPTQNPVCPEGGEAQAIRTVFSLLRKSRI
nr:leucyl aminopeptidase family protein [Lutibaculum baratangense]